MEEKEKLQEDIQKIKTGEMPIEDDFNNPHYIAFDFEGNKVYDGHSLLHNESTPNK